ncbi:MAG TPA: ATP-binding protein [Longimicrobium sp.]|jgi:hypothetical protein|nr:ATP-binding protein [Longimicrobium sp.]
MELGLRGPVTEEQARRPRPHSADVTDVPVGEALAAAEALIMPQVRARGLTCSTCSPMPSSSPTRAASCGVACDARPDVVAILVADTGVGIAADKLATGFEPFVQVDQRLTRPHEGVELGLAISRDLARGMGGDLVAESTPGAGSTFTLTLPAS